MHIQQRDDIQGVKATLVYYLRLLKFIPRNNKFVLNLCFQFLVILGLGLNRELLIKNDAYQINELLKININSQIKPNLKNLIKTN